MRFRFIKCALVTGERKICEHKMFPGLCARHLIKEKFANQESYRGEEGDDSHCVGELARRVRVVDDAVLLALQVGLPGLVTDHRKHQHGEKLEFIEVKAAERGKFRFFSGLTSRDIKLLSWQFLPQLSKMHYFD